MPDKQNVIILLTQEEKELITVVLANSAHDPESVDIHEDVTKLYHKVQPLWGTPECLDMEG